MADQKRWFKLWCSAPSDDDLLSLPPEIRWAWAAFGCYTKEHGTRGTVTISPTNAVLAAQMGVTLDVLQATISRLPHVHVEEGKTDNGKFAVTWQNWQKYQEDSTVAERVARLRSKRRGEERRGEEKKKRSTPPDPPLPLGMFLEGSDNGHARPVFAIPELITAALNRAPRLGADPAIRTPKFWQAEIRANPTVDYPTEILKAEAWLVAHPERHYKKLSGFLHNWLARADRDET